MSVQGVSPPLPESILPRMGLILSGGGARAAYQVGVLKAFSEHLPKTVGNPFPIICGTSAGAINAAVLASRAQSFRLAVRGLERVWANITAEQVYRTEFRAFVKSILKWLVMSAVSGHTPVNSALLDSTPLKKLLSLVINFDRIQQAIDAGALEAVSISATSYGRGESISFFQGADSVGEWQRSRRIGRRAQIGVQHLLASSAIPILFPATEVDGTYYGDGAVRQFAPLSPALHLGAEKVMVIGVSQNRIPPPDKDQALYPSLAVVLGHILNSIFVDTLEGDVERLLRINRTLSLIPEETRKESGTRLRPIEVMTIYPSEPIDEIAAKHVHNLPRSLRFFLRAPGATRSPGGSAVSYLLFEPGFTRELIALGYRDGCHQLPEIREFLLMPAN